jgi:NAD(P)-dependent dehydrogenase (short-subunit alcohol dehydrogenase family)
MLVYPSEMTAANLAKEANLKPVYPASVIPEQRMGDEQDIAGAILFLASRAGAYCNGNVLVTDGGRLSVTPASY